MPTFTAAFREAVYPRNVRTIPFFQVAWPTGTERYADRPHGLVGVGALAPRILDIVSFSLGPGSLKIGGLTFPETSVTLDDGDGHLREMIEGGASVAGSACSLGWTIPGIPWEDRHTALVGVIGKPSYEPGVVHVPVRAQDKPLEAPVPKAQILSAEAAFALESSRGVYFRLLYGEHDASALTGRGMVPCVNWSHGGAGVCRYALCLGWAKSVDRVYLNGVLQTLTTHYTINHPVIGGKRITSIDFVSATDADAVVTADAQGYEDVGDGTGELILNPVDQLQHFLANFAFQDWRHGAWKDAADSPIDLVSFARAASFASTMGFEGALSVGGTQEAEQTADVLQRWLGSWLAFRPFWTSAGKLGLGPLSHLFRGYESPGMGDPGPALFVRAIHEIGESFVVSADPTVLRRVDMAYLYGAQDSKFWANLAVQDVSQDQEAGEAFQLFASAAHLI